MFKRIAFRLLLIRLISMTYLNVAFVICLTININAQSGNDSIAWQQMNSINLHIIGDGSFFSGTYERIFPVRKSFFLSTRAGLGYTKEWQICIYGPCNFPPAPIRLTFVHAFTANLGGPRVNFEIGYGGNMIMEPEAKIYLPYLTGGIRWNTYGAIPFVFRGFYNYPLRTNKSVYLFMPVGLSIGLRF